MPPLTGDPARDWGDGMSRRDFVRLLSASVALAGITGCVREPSEPIFPYIHPPASGGDQPLHYATAMALDGFATGLLVTCRDGRPIKIEGNPTHPSSLGASTPLQQAALLELYDPHRAHIASRRSPAAWSAIRQRLGLDALRPIGGARGDGLVLLMDPVSSPVTIALLDRIREELPSAAIHFQHSTDDGAMLAAHQALFGRPLLPQHDLARAEVVVTIEADLLARGPWQVRDAHDFGARRRSGAPQQWFVAEAMPSPTGSIADHRLAMHPLTREAIALALLHAVATQLAAPYQAPAAPAAPAIAGDAAAWVTAAAQTLIAHRGRCVVAAGDQCPDAVHRAVAAINALVAGDLVWYIDSPIQGAGESSHTPGRLQQLAQSADHPAWIITATNPCYALPGDLGLDTALARARWSAYLAASDDETARRAADVIPAAHFLESWDAHRAWDGTITPMQPMVAPLFAGQCVNTVLAAILGDARTPRALLQAFAPDAAQDDALRAGALAGSASPPVATHVDWRALPQPPEATPASSSFAVVFPPSHATHDGRFAGNAWLQELPDPVTQLTWDNALCLSPSTAEARALATGDVTRLRAGNDTIDVPVIVVPGHADDCGTLALGYGRQGAGILEDPIGVATNGVRKTTRPLLAADVSLLPLHRTHPLATTQTHWSLEDRRDEILGGAKQPPATPASLWRGTTPPGHDGFGADQWAMTIDLDLCTGCSACVVACQAENNIPVVGKEGVLESREMHWIRIEHYRDPERTNGTLAVQPMLCQHCEHAPCEYVCPVNATVHSDDGLNEMVYNRCVGTRFCSNNCPYKVRRFNWLNYHEGMTPVDELLNNPDVTVRSRGVMEKCTFCVQRIRRAQESAELSGAPRTGPVMTACQQSCPTGAIVFGSLTNPDDAVVSAFRDPRAYAALGSLDTRPRVHYLARREAAT